MAEQPPFSLVCGPTCGCGKSTPFEQVPGGRVVIAAAAGSHWIFGPDNRWWQSPKTCMHCGQGFGPQFVVDGLQAKPATSALGFPPGETPLAVTAGFVAPQVTKPFDHGAKADGLVIEAENG